MAKKLITLMSGKDFLKIPSEEIFKEIQNRVNKQVQPVPTIPINRERANQAFKRIMAQAKEESLISLGIEPSKARRISRMHRFKDQSQSNSPNKKIGQKGFAIPFVIWIIVAASTLILGTSLNP